VRKGAEAGSAAVPMVRLIETRVNNNARPPKSYGREPVVLAISLISLTGGVALNSSSESYGREPVVLAISLIGGSP
jgi:hypothetical protein